MTQITKTLSIAGIIATVGAPAMADIASTAYVQSIVNNVIPTSGTVGDVLKKTEDGFVWAAAPSTELKTTTGQSTTASMTQKAITDALDKKVENTAMGIGAFAIGTDSLTTATGPSSLAINADAGGFSAIAIGVSDGDDELNVSTHANGAMSIAIGYGAKVDTDAAAAVAIGRAMASGSSAIAIGGRAMASGSSAIAIGDGADAPGSSGIAIGNSAGIDDSSGIAIGNGAYASGEHTIQLGEGENLNPRTFAVGFSETDTDDDYISFPLLVYHGVIPAGRLTAPNLDGDGRYISDNNGVSGQLLQTNGDGTMSWVNAADSVLPELIGDCKVSGQRCALITTWNSTTQKPEYTWEVVKVNQ